MIFYVFLKKTIKKWRIHTKLRNSPLPATPPKKTAHMGVLLVPPPETKKNIATFVAGRPASPVMVVGVVNRQFAGGSQCFSFRLF